MTRLTPNLSQTCRKVTITRNKFGDLEYGTSQSMPCLFRDITTLQTSQGNREQVTVDGIFWFEPDSGVERGDIILFDSEYFRMDKVTEARSRVTDNRVHFIKCEAMRQRQVS